MRAFQFNLLVSYSDIFGYFIFDGGFEPKAILYMRVQYPKNRSDFLTILEL